VPVCCVACAEGSRQLILCLVRRLAYRMNPLRIFYPGSLWSKRITHLVGLSTLGISLFLGNVQSKVIDASQKLAGKTFEESIGTVEKVEAFIDEGAIRSFVLRRFADIPAAKSQLADVKQKLVESDKMSTQLYALLNKLLFIAGCLMVGFTISLVWISCDLYWGDSRGILVPTLFAVALFNWLSYRYLTSYLERILHSITSA
jgi:hypothetical protein